MSGIGKFVVPGSRILKSIAYDRKRHRLRGLKMVHWLSKVAINDVSHVKIKPVTYAGLDSAWFLPNSINSDKVILYLHGGGYSVCSWKTHKSLISYICKKAGMKSLAINYRMAPEFPFPTAVEDTVKVVKKLIADHGNENVILGGDSAGGGLCFATLLALKQEGSPLPSKVFAFSPWLDLSVPLFSGEGHLNGDPMLDPEAVNVWAKRYLNGKDPKHPWASPIYGDLSGLPPFLIHIGEREMLLDESVSFASEAREKGVKANIRIFPDMVHVFQLMHSILPEAKESISEIAKFLNSD